RRRDIPQGASGIPMDARAAQGHEVRAVEPLRGQERRQPRSEVTQRRSGEPAEQAAGRRLGSQPQVECGTRVSGGMTMSLIVRSPAFTDGQPIPRRHTGDGEDLSPPLSWSGLPAAARGLALIVEDPDAPTQEPWVHWVIYNLQATEEGLVEGIAPVGRPGSP